MQTIRLIPIMLISVFSLALHPAQAQTVRAPVPAEGNSWEYKTTNMWSSKIVSQLNKKTIGIAGDYVRMFFETREMPKNGEFVKPQVSEGTVRADLNTNAMFRGEKLEQVWYKWPLEPGKKWEFQTKEEYPSPSNSAQQQVLTMNMKAEVIGWETLEVPAGKFKAIKIVYKNNWTTENPVGTGTSINTVWYCPEVKASVQSTYESFGADGSPQTRTKQQLTQFDVK